MKYRAEPERDYAKDIVAFKNLAMLWCASAALPFFLFPGDEGWGLYNSFALLFFLFFVSLSLTETLKARHQQRPAGTVLFAIVPALLFAASTLIYWIRRLGGWG